MQETINLKDKLKEVWNNNPKRIAIALAMILAIILWKIVIVGLLFYAVYLMWKRYYSDKQEVEIIKPKGMR